MSGLITDLMACTLPSAISRAKTLMTRPSASRVTAPGWPLTQVGSRLAPIFGPWRASPSMNRATWSGLWNGLATAQALPPPAPTLVTSGASSSSRAARSPPAAAAKNRRVTSSHFSREASKRGPLCPARPWSTCCRARAKI